MPTSRDVESAFLQAQVDVNQWRDEFLAEWFKPEMDLMLAMFWKNMDPMMKKFLQQTRPQAYQEMERRVAMQGGQDAR